MPISAITLAVILHKLNGHYNSFELRLFSGDLRMLHIAH